MKNQNFKPALATTLKDPVKTLVFPVLVSPKLDGIRALVINGQLVSRSLKLIPNKLLQRLLGHHVLNGLDGELIVGDPKDSSCFRKTSSIVMSHDGNPKDVYFHVFDVVPKYANAYDGTSDRTQYVDRLAAIPGIVRESKKFKLDKRIIGVPQFWADTFEQLNEFEAQFCNEGYEGLISRRVAAMYREDRCTPKEQSIVKFKRFKDSEATILNVLPLKHNTNEALADNLGNLKRSSHKAGKQDMPLMGALTVVDVHTGVEFEIGTGFNQIDRKWFWKHRNAVDGVILKYKYFPVGVKDKPRHPVYLGLRNTIDM
jgi:DNA ligase 1